MGADGGVSDLGGVSLQGWMKVCGERALACHCLCL